jgi:hypothetical protein
VHFAKVLDHPLESRGQEKKEYCFPRMHLKANSLLNACHVLFIMSTRIIFAGSRYGKILMIKWTTSGMIDECYELVLPFQSIFSFCNILNSRATAATAHTSATDLFSRQSKFRL